jgi:bifunctional DNase/RNase
MTTLDLNLKSKSEWIEMFPFGVAMGANQLRPVMIFKDKDERRVLPVWLSHMDAGIAVAQSTPTHNVTSNASGSPHELSWQVLTELGIALEKCLFKKVTGHHQFVELQFSAKGQRKLPAKLLQFEARADDAISFCLRSGCQFFATVDYIEKSRVLEGEIGLVANEKMAQQSLPPRYLN